VALHALLLAAEVGPGDEVLVPGFTCVVVPAAICYTGATPVFYDVDPESWNGDPTAAAALVGPRTKAILIQHTFGAISDPAPFLALAEDSGSVVIEDCAHAMGSTFEDRPAGTLGHGAFTSLQWSKVVTTGLGGIARFESRQLRRGFDTVRHLYSEPATTKQFMLRGLEVARALTATPGLFWTAQRIYRTAGRWGLVPGSSENGELSTATEPAGYRTLFGDARRPRLDAALERLEHTLSHRRRAASAIREFLRTADLPRQKIDERCTSAHVRVPTVVENRAAMLAHAQRERVEIGDWFNSPLHPADAASEAFGYRHGMCPVAEWLCERLVNLPTHPRVHESDLDRTLRFVRRRVHRTGQVKSAHPIRSA
jgi:dTDP-4-amino-4,6-dideoxygalactose transaminase